MRHKLYIFLSSFATIQVVSFITSLTRVMQCSLPPRLPGSEYKSDGDARWKIQIKPLRETNVGVAQA